MRLTSLAAWVPAFMLAIFDIANLPSQIQPLLQQGYLETSFDDYLTANNGYWAGADNESFSEDIFGKHKGTTITRTRPGLKAPVVVATDNVAAQTPPNNGVNASDFSVEQYTFAPFELSDGINLDLIGTNFAIVDRFMHQTDVSYNQAVQSIDLLARDTFIAGYVTGNTLANSTAAAGNGVSLNVDDLRGFDTVITVSAGGTNGKVLPTSPSNPLPAIVYPGGSVTGSFAVTVTATAASVSNTSNFVPFTNGPSNPYGVPGVPTTARGNGVSGALTLNVPTGKSIAIGDVITAGDAPAQGFATGVLHFAKMPTSGSNLTQAMLLDAVGQLQSDAVPFSMNRAGENEGTYLCHISPKVMRSLYNDSDFKQANQTLGLSQVYQRGKVSQYVGVTFLENTNVPRIPLAPYGGSGYAYLTIVAGQGAIIDAAYEGLEDWAQSRFNPGYVVIEHGIAQILMPAYADRQGRRMNIDWLSIRDMICPTDVTRSTVVLTGSAGRRARAHALWTFLPN